MIKKFPKLYKFAKSGATQEWEIEAVDNKETGQSYYTVSHGQKDGAIQTTFTITHGKNIGKKNETTAFQQACSEAESKWKKQIDKGYGTSAVARKITAPMLAHPYEENKDKVVFPCYFQPKLDGVRCIAEKDNDEVILWSRMGKKFEAVPHINEELNCIMSNGEILDGELYSHGTTFQTLLSWIKRNQEDSKKVKYNVYDMVSDKPFNERFSDFCRIVGTGKKYIKTVYTTKLHSHDDIVFQEEQATAKGYEGIMLRVGKCSYQSGQRSRELLKVKSFKDAEFTIVGVHDGKGKAEGQATFICITDNGVEFNCRIKGEDSVREEALQNSANYIGKKLTVKFFEWTTSEKPVPRFPVGIAVREYE